MLWVGLRILPADGQRAGHGAAEGLGECVCFALIFVGVVINPTTVCIV